MEYSINQLAKLSGITTRTLRYYDEIGLLTPSRTRSNGYRVYGQYEVDLLQQILFYRELDMPLDEIKRFVLSKDFDGKVALESHLSSLLGKKEKLSLLIANVEKTILSLKGEIVMNDKEKFEGFKQTQLDKNEQQYGEEIRNLYGNEAVSKSNKKFKGMTQEQYADVERISLELNESLKVAFEQGDPSSEIAQEMCGLHKKWICCFWDNYSKEAHIGLAQMYVADPRFTEYYNKIAIGCAEFLRDAIQIYCEQ